MIREITTEEDRLQEFEDKIGVIQRDEIKHGKTGLTMFCPWCRKINNGDGEPCCFAFSEALENRANRQLQEFFGQYHRVETGQSESITCPYCGDANWIPSINPTTTRRERDPLDWKRPNVSPFCCDLFQQAALAVAKTKGLQEKIDQCKRIQDGIERAERN